MSKPLSIDDIRNMRAYGREQFDLTHVDLLITAYDGRNNDALSMQLQRDQALRDCERLRNRDHTITEEINCIGVTCDTLQAQLAAVTAERDAIKRTREQEEQYDSMCHALRLTREALAWVLDHGVMKAVHHSHVDGKPVPRLVNGDYDSIEPPAHLAPILAEAIRSKT